MTSTGDNEYGSIFSADNLEGLSSKLGYPKEDVVRALVLGLMDDAPEITPEEIASVFAQFSEPGALESYSDLFGDDAYVDADTGSGETGLSVGEGTPDDITLKDSTKDDDDDYGDEDDFGDDDDGYDDYEDYDDDDEEEDDDVTDSDERIKDKKSKKGCVSDETMKNIKGALCGLRYW